MTMDRPVAEPAATSITGVVEKSAPVEQNGMAHAENGSPPVTAPDGDGDVGRPGERLERLRRRQRLLREELLALVVLLLVLAATVAVLATQWLGSGPTANALSHLLSGGTT